MWTIADLGLTTAGQKALEADLSAYDDTAPSGGVSSRQAKLNEYIEANTLLNTPRTPGAAAPQDPLAKYRNLSGLMAATLREKYNITDPAAVNRALVNLNKEAKGSSGVPAKDPMQLLNEKIALNEDLSTLTTGTDIKEFKDGLAFQFTDTDRPKDVYTDSEWVEARDAANKYYQTEAKKPGTGIWGVDYFTDAFKDTDPEHWGKLRKKVRDALKDPQELEKLTADTTPSYKASKSAERAGKAADAEEGKKAGEEGWFDSMSKRAGQVQSMAQAPEKGFKTASDLRDSKDKLLNPNKEKGEKLFEGQLKDLKGAKKDLMGLGKDRLTRYKDALTLKEVYHSKLIEGGAGKALADGSSVAKEYLKKKEKGSGHKQDTENIREENQYAEALRQRDRNGLKV